MTDESHASHCVLAISAFLYDMLLFFIFNLVFHPHIMVGLLKTGVLASVGRLDEGYPQSILNDVKMFPCLPLLTFFRTMSIQDTTVTAS